MKYKLEPYKSKANRYTCPQCGRNNCFTRYVCIETGKYVNDSVGKCDHISKCGYHYTPRQFYKDNPWETEGEESSVSVRKRFAAQKIEKPDPVYFPLELVDKYSNNGADNFISWLRSICSVSAVSDAQRLYKVGTTTPGKYKSKGIIFWQIDKYGLVHDGKIMWYRPDGHREKSMTWVSAIMKKKGLYPEQDTEKRLFGEHLLEAQQTCDLPVCIVESEKSAIVCSILFPDFTWLATCGCGGLNKDKLRALTGRTFAVFPDSGSYDKWLSILTTSGHKCIVYDRLEGYAPNTDLVDVLIDGSQPLPEQPKANIQAFLDYFKSTL